MRVEVHTDSEEEESKEESTEQDADTIQELTAEAIKILNADSPVADTTPTPPMRAPIQIEYMTGTDNWHAYASNDRQGTHMYGGTDITMVEAVFKSAEDLTRGIFRSANTIAPEMTEDSNARGHKLPSRIDQNRPWTRWNNSPSQSDYTLCQVC